MISSTARILIVGVVLVFAVCSGGTGELDSTRRPRETWPAEVVLGLVPSEGGADILTRYAPLTAHLTSVLGIGVKPSSASDYAGVITAMAHKHVDVAYLGPKAYIEAAARADAQAVALELSVDGQPGYRGLIVARTSDGATTLDQLKGKTFAFTDPNSMSGYLVPLMHFKRDLKTDPKGFFSEVRFAGSHAASVLAVKNGSVAAAATNDLDLARIVSAGQVTPKELTAVWTSELIPGAPMAVRRALPESLKAAIIGALMTIGDDHHAIKGLGNGGYIYANDQTYDVIRYLINLEEQDREER